MEMGTAYLKSQLALIEEIDRCLPDCKRRQEISDPDRALEIAATGSDAATGHYLAWVFGRSESCNLNDGIDNFRCVHQPTNISPYSNLALQNDAGYLLQSADASGAVSDLCAVYQVSLFTRIFDIDSLAHGLRQALQQRVGKTNPAYSTVPPLQNIRATLSSWSERVQRISWEDKLDEIRGILFAALRIPNQPRMPGFLPVHILQGCLDFFPALIALPKAHETRITLRKDLTSRDRYAALVLIIAWAHCALGLTVRLTVLNTTQYQQLGEGVPKVILLLGDHDSIELRESTISNFFPEVLEIPPLELDMIPVRSSMRTPAHGSGDVLLKKVQVPNPPPHRDEMEIEDSEGDDDRLVATIAHAKLHVMDIYEHDKARNLLFESVWIRQAIWICDRHLSDLDLVEDERTQLLMRVTEFLLPTIFSRLHVDNLIKSARKRGDSLIKNSNGEELRIEVAKQLSSLFIAFVLVEDLGAEAPVADLPIYPESRISSYVAANHHCLHALANKMLLAPQLLGNRSSVLAGHHNALLLHENGWAIYDKILELPDPIVAASHRIVVKRGIPIYDGSHKHIITDEISILRFDVPADRQAPEKRLHCAVPVPQIYETCIDRGGHTGMPMHIKLREDGAGQRHQEIQTFSYSILRAILADPNVNILPRCRHGPVAYAIGIDISADLPRGAYMSSVPACKTPVERQTLVYATAGNALARLMALRDVVEWKDGERVYVRHPECCVFCVREYLEGKGYMERRGRRVLIL